MTSWRKDNIEDCGEEEKMDEGLVLYQEEDN